MNEWVAGASDDEVVDMFNHGDIGLAMAVWSALGEDRIMQIHQRVGLLDRWQDIINSREYRDYEAHEKMMPSAFKAEFQPADTPPEVGSLINGSLICIDNEDAAFPECLDKCGQIRPIFNAKLKQFQWAPTAEEAKKSTHYELGNYDV